MSSVRKPKKLVIITTYPYGTVGGQRFRHELFLSELDESWKVEYLPFWTENGYNNLYRGGRELIKLSYLIRGFIFRCLHLFRCVKSDLIYVYRESGPIGRPLLIWLLKRVFSKKIIYDFDDAIWLKDESPVNTTIQRLKYYGKVKSLSRLANKVICGNEYLMQYAQKFNSNVVVLPTCVDTLNYHNKVVDHGKHKTSVGWTGSHSTIKYLERIAPILAHIQEELDFTLIVIANREPLLPGVNYEFIPWCKETEIKDLQRIHIGLMPMQDNEWSKGKCGFKAIQYGALGIPSVVSPVGVNKEIVLHGRTGFHATNPEDWHRAILKLLNDETLRQSMGVNARSHIEERYALKMHSEVFKNTLLEVLS